MHVAKKLVDGSPPSTRPRAASTFRGKSLERARLEQGGRLPLEEVLQIADVLLFHMDQGHKRGARFRHLHASMLSLLDDGSLVVERSSVSHGQAPEPEVTSNEQTDVLVVGALFFYLLTGVEPRVTLHEPAPSLSRLAPDLPLQIVRAIQRALHPRRGVRWLDVAELRDALFGDEAARRTLPVGFQRPEWARELMDRAHARRAGCRAG